MNASFGGRSGGWVEITGKEGNRYAPKFQLDLSMLSLGFLFESPIAKSQKHPFWSHSEGVIPIKSLHLFFKRFLILHIIPALLWLMIMHHQR
jgi:hypothetical protein